MKAPFQNHRLGFWHHPARGAFQPPLHPRLDSAHVTFLLAWLVLGAAPPQCYAASDGLDLSFNAGSDFNGTVATLALLPDGKVLVGGDFTSLYGVAATTIARLNPDGNMDSSFSAAVTCGGDDAWVNHIAPQADGKVLIAGGFTAVNGQPRTNIARLKADGSLDDSFQSCLAPNSGLWMQLQADEKILVAGSWSPLNEGDLVRLNPDGSLDSTFTAEVVNAWRGVDVLGLQSDGKIIVGGPSGIQITNVPEGTFLMARLNADGSADSSFNCQLAGIRVDSTVYVNSIAFQADGKILIGGCFASVNGVNRNGVARINADGSLDSSFLYATDEDFGYVYGVALQTDGKVLMVGCALNGVEQNIVRLNSDGTLDGSFHCDTDGQIDRVALQDDGRIFMVGGITSVNGLGRCQLACLKADGSLDDVFVNILSGPNGEIRTLSLGGDEKVLIGGEFTFVDGLPYGGLAQLTPDGSLDTSFANPAFFHPYMWMRNPLVYSLALQDDGKIIVGGQFTAVDGVARTNIARLNADGSLDTSFLGNAELSEADPSSVVTSVALQSNGQVVIAGDFNLVRGIERTIIARLNADGSLDTSFDAHLGLLGASAGALSIDRDGRIIVAGYLDNVSPQTHEKLARLNADGTPDDSFIRGCVDEGWLNATAPQPDGKIVIGGQFTSFNGVAHTNIARLNRDGTLDDSFLAGTDHVVKCIILQDDGKILIGGSFSQVNGVSRNGLARLNPDGSLDASFLEGLSGAEIAGGGAGGGVSGLALQRDKMILVGGSFTSFNQTPRSYIARLMGDYATPAISTEAPSRTVEVGSSTTLGVIATGCDLTYQWTFNGSLIAGATNSTLQLAQASSAQAGAYAVIVTNAAGTVTSNPAMLSVIPPVPRRTVPALNLTGDVGSLLHLSCANTLGSGVAWRELGAVTLTSTQQLYPDLTLPMPSARFYCAWQTNLPTVSPALEMRLATELTLTGAIGGHVRIDRLNQYGPTDAWVTLDTVALTNTTQRYVDYTMFRQPTRLYRLVSIR